MTMTKFCLIWSVVSLLGSASATTYYADASRIDDSGNGLTWGAAKQTIQAAINVSASNDTIVVTNGVYTPISTANKKITIRSVNGAPVTIIDGGGTNRCATLGSDSSHTNTTLTGFTLQNGNANDFTGNAGSGIMVLYGGGSYGGTLNSCVLRDNTAQCGGGCAAGVLKNCIIVGNTARGGGGGGSWYGTLNNCKLTDNSAMYSSGGGSFYGTLNNCVFSGNTASSGGGSYWSALNNCTLAGNSASGGECVPVGYSGSGSYGGTMNNCIVWNNYSPEGDVDNYYDSSFAYSCTWPLAAGEGNIDYDPQFHMPEIGDFRLSEGSSCIDAGNDVFAVGVTDYSGHLRIQGSAVDMGAYEGEFPLLSDDTHRVLSLVASTNQTQGITLQWLASVDAVLYQVLRMNAQTQTWEPITEWISDLAFTDTHVVASLDYNYAIIAAFDANANTISTFGNIVTGMKAFQPQWYVDASRPDDAGDGTSWLTAKRTIQAAVNLAQPYESILVADGVYPPIVTDNKLLLIRGVHGASVTVIDGGFTNRCATLGRRKGEADTVLEGFMLRNGYADYDGLYYNNGGGTYGGTLNKCILTENVAEEDGGGAYYSILSNCIVSNNWTSYSGGGGVGQCVLNNCLLMGNMSGYGGGGANESLLKSCTVVGNMSGSADQGCGAQGSTLLNCIVWGNLAGGIPSNYRNSDLSYNCTWPLPAEGVGNITLEPKFRDAAAGDYRLLSSSPCVNAGTNGLAVGVLDLDGNPRIMNACVDMGAYELMIPSVANALEGSTLAWKSGGAAEWFAQNEVVKEGDWAMQSGPVGDNQESWIETALNGPGRISFWWRVSSEGAYDWLLYSVDSEERNSISGSKDSAWSQETVYLEASHVMRWTYRKDESQREGTDAGWLDGVQWSPRVTVLFDGQGGSVSTNAQTYYAGDGYTNLPTSYLVGALFGGWWTTPSGDGVEVHNGIPVASTNHTLYARWLSVNEVLNSPETLVWTLGGDAVWFAQTNVVKQGVAALQSGSIGHNQQTWIETTVQGGCNLSFWWRVSSEGNYDFLSYSVNGILKKSISGAKNVAWIQESLTFANAGAYTIRWTYGKDGSGVAGEDRGWLDGVSVTPLLQQTSTTVPIPFTWLDLYYPGLAGSSAYETTALEMGANNRPVWESYVAGLNPTNPLSQFVVQISVSNDMRFITWTPDLRPDRVYTVLGKTNMTDAVWGPTNSASQFFRVRVEML